MEIKAVRTRIFENYEQYFDRDYLFISAGQMINCPENFRTYRPDGRADWQALYIRKGCMAFNGQKCPQGTFYVYRPYEPQDYATVGADCCYYWLHFGGKHASAIFGQKIYENFEYGDSFMRFIEFCEREFDEMRFGYDDIVLAEMILFFNKTKRFFIGEKPTSVNKAVSYINRNCADRCSNQAYAEMCGLSTGYFIRQFKAVTGKTPVQYRNSLLVIKAKKLLSTTDLSVGEISERLGFDDFLYFSRVFKKHTGFAPSDYKKMC